MIEEKLERIADALDKIGDGLGVIGAALAAAADSAEKTAPAADKSPTEEDKPAPKAKRKRQAKAETSPGHSRPKKHEAPPVEDPEGDPESGEELSLDDVRSAAQRVILDGHLTKVREILRAAGAERVQDLDENKFRQVFNALQNV